MAEWSNFYILSGTAAATLMGLMFVGLTLGAKLVTPETAPIARATLSPIVYHFAHAFLIASVALFAKVDPGYFGAFVALTGLLRMMTLPALVLQLRKAQGASGDIERSDWILDIVIPVLLYAILLISGIYLAMGQDRAEYGIASMVLSLNVLGIISAWDMFIWMASKV